MRLLIVSATPFEIASLRSFLETGFEKKSDYIFKKNGLIVHLLITGVGMTYTAYCLGRILSQNRFDLAINVGLAGAFNRSFKIGDVVHVISERFGDLGVEESDGNFTDVHELGLIDSNNPPFQNGVLINPGAGDFTFLSNAKGLTINKVHGFVSNIKITQKKYNADVESMEGAAFFLVCLLEKIPFLEIRSISNYVEPRNKENWNLPLAIENLNKIVIELLGVFGEEKNTK